jgi:hypothetical protein
MRNNLLSILKLINGIRTHADATPDDIKRCDQMLMVLDCISKKIEQYSQDKKP